MSTLIYTFATSKQDRATTQRLDRKMHTSLTTRGAAHDIRHLLSTIRLTAELLEATGTSEVARRAQRILRAVDRGTDICGSFVDGSAPEAPGSSDIGAILGDVLAQLSPPSGIRLKLDCPDRLEATLSEIALFRAVFNLASNALDAVVAHGGSFVRLRARVIDDQLIITVEDDGPGLAGAEHGRRAQEGAPPSAGLGLNLVRSLAARLGGRLRLLRTGPEGTVFALVLPLRQAHPSEAVELASLAL